MITFALAFVTCLFIFLGVDMVWLLWLGRPFYVTEIGGLLRTQPNLPAAIAFYLVYAAGLVFFAVMPGLKETSALTALAYGAFFGLVAYATYDLTNLAVMNAFTTRIALIDLAWGTVLSGFAAWATTRVLLFFSVT